MKRAFFGGSFDPVHCGHVAMADYVLTAGLVDVVHVVPAWLSPHKKSTGASVAHREAMVRLAFAESANLIIDCTELAKRRLSYTVETLDELHRRFFPDEWLLIIGSDNLDSFHAWHQASRLAAMAHVVVLGRPGHELTSGRVSAAGLDVSSVLMVPEFNHPVSSSGVRAMLAAGAATTQTLISGGVPAAVAQFIVEQNLYTLGENGGYCVADTD